MTSSDISRMREAVYLNWEESERDWGVRPDGCSLHLKEEDCRKFVNEYWNGMPDEVLDEYSRPAGRPAKAYVSKRLYEEIEESGYGIRLLESEESTKVENKELVYGPKRSGWIRRNDGIAVSEQY